MAAKVVSGLDIRSPKLTTDLTRYANLLGDIKIRATLAANAEMILMYWNIRRMITERQQREGWGQSLFHSLRLI